MPKAQAVMTGYEKEDRYFGTRFNQGGRRVYSIELSLTGVTTTLPRPDPSRLTEGNRKINDAHARDFGQYVRLSENWVAPALLIRSSDIFRFETLEEVDGVQFGILSIPRLARNDLKILDGQHRILGLYYAVDGVAADLDKKRGLLAAAKRQGNDQGVHEYQAEVKQLEEQRQRLDRERIAVDIYVEDEPESYKQMFVDIADNAVGITSTIKARFDHRKVVNRALDSVLEHALLKGRVDLQQDRVVGSSLYLMGAKHVAEFIRAVTIGISGRVSRRQEGELNEADLAERANNFLDILTASFPALSDVVDGNLSTEALRKTSLLGSTTMLRILAGVYHGLATEKSDEQIADFFAKLAPFMGAPVAAGSPWLQAPGNVFSVGASAPKARYQDVKKVTEMIVGWFKNEPEWIRAA